jgi:soluble lytic murein transglycosylase
MKPSMGARSRATAAALAVALAAGGARAENPAAAIRADRWADAQAEAAAEPDPLAGKLVAFYRMLAPGAAGYAEIAAFARENPSWPQAALLERRRQEALARETDPSALAEGCATPLTAPAALLRCVEVERDPARAATLAERAWPGIVDPAAQAAFLRRWGASITTMDEWQKFEALAWAGSPAAAAQAARLSGEMRAVAEARLALRRDDRQAQAMAEAIERRVEPALFPGLFLERAKNLRRAGREADALALWTAQGLSEEAASGRPAEFWTERNILARRLLAIGDRAGAYLLASQHGDLPPEQTAEAEFLAGFVALRLLSDPARALPHFEALAQSKAAITQGRAHHWLALAQQAAGGDGRAELELSAGWPLTYYGQLSAALLGEAAAARIEAARDPAWTDAQAAALTAEELPRAALLLSAWGEGRRAATFLVQAAEDFDPVRRSELAHLAVSLGLPQAAVAIARRMGRDGQVLPQAGWPRPFEPPSPPDPALSLGVMRQESSFDAGALSLAGARGLMQLMPATAKMVAAATRTAGGADDPAVNMRLGTAYLQSLLDQFSEPALAVAAYNAGPHRVREWLATYGDPRVGPVKLADWVELIPFDETRNYVQRVLENATVFRAR